MIIYEKPERETCDLGIYFRGDGGVKLLGFIDRESALEFMSRARGEGCYFEDDGVEFFIEPHGITAFSISEAL